MVDWVSKQNRIRTVIDSKDCCGCNACIQICPKECIGISYDEAGFAYPHINLDDCIDCRLCERVCPVINIIDNHIPIEQYAAYSQTRELRMRSSSGGIFSLLSEQVISKGGVVYGAGFNKDWSVSHSFCESVSGLQKYQGSKYVQSDLEDCYLSAKRFLQEDRDVLFSGTPCQISGLKLFLRKEYPNLITIEVGCHGVPSPKVWLDYISQIKATGSFIDFSFRDKSQGGWEKYSYCVTRSDGTRDYIYYGKNQYSDAFLNNYTLRPSCFNCKSKLETSRADITICDYWGVKKFHPDMDDNLGCSAVIIHTIKGQTLFNSISCSKRKTQLNSIIAGNMSLINSTQKPLKYEQFWVSYKKKGISVIKEYTAVEHVRIKSVAVSVKKIVSLVFHALFSHHRS